MDIQKIALGALHEARSTAEGLLVTYYTVNGNQHASQFHFDGAIKSFKKLADALGYDLIKREDQTQPTLEAAE